MLGEAAESIRIASTGCVIEPRFIGTVASNRTTNQREPLNRVSCIYIPLVFACANVQIVQVEE